MYLLISVLTSATAFAQINKKAKKGRDQKKIAATTNAANAKLILRVYKRRKTLSIRTRIKGSESQG